MRRHIFIVVACLFAFTGEAITADIVGGIERRRPAQEGENRIQER